MNIITTTTEHPAWSLAYLEYLFTLAKGEYPTIERDQIAVVVDGGGFALEFFEPGSSSPETSDITHYE